MNISERNFVSTLYVYYTFCILSDVSKKFPREISEKKLLLSTYMFLFILVLL